MSINSQLERCAASRVEWLSQRLSFVRRRRRQPGLALDSLQLIVSSA